MPHLCALCLKTQQRVYGPYGFKAWPAIAGKSFTWGGYIWACDDHRAELKRIWQRETAAASGMPLAPPGAEHAARDNTKPPRPSRGHEQGTLL